MSVGLPYGALQVGRICSYSLEHLSSTKNSLSRTAGDKMKMGKCMWGTRTISAHLRDDTDGENMESHFVCAVG